MRKTAQYNSCIKTQWDKNGGRLIIMTCLISMSKGDLSFVGDRTGSVLWEFFVNIPSELFRVESELEERTFTKFRFLLELLKSIDLQIQVIVKVQVKLTNGIFFTQRKELFFYF
jgi:hypothetical protein